MTDRDCVDFLREALPRMRLRWEGHRNVRGQVCKRVARRMRELGVANTLAYRGYLEAHEEEWSTLRQLCRVTISRFYRDHGVFRVLEHEVLPRLASLARRRDDGTVAVWCAGCAGGEEAYTLALVWHLRVAPAAGGVRMRVLATDVDAEEIERARAGLFPTGALTELPEELLRVGFDETNGRYRVRDRFREGLEFQRSDLTQELPGGPFDLVLCRNLAFTYFDEALQAETAVRLASRMTPGGVLVVGKHETVPGGSGLVPVFGREWLYEWHAGAAAEHDG
jgi:chemotaxis protein methyltransferase CheR